MTWVVETRTATRRMSDGAWDRLRPAPVLQRTPLQSDRDGVFDGVGFASRWPRMFVLQAVACSSFEFCFGFVELFDVFRKPG